MESLLIPDNLDSNMLSSLVVQCPNYLTEAALADYLKYLVSISQISRLLINDSRLVLIGKAFAKIKLPVGNVIMWNFVVATGVIIVTTVLRSLLTMDFTRRQSQVPDLRVFFNFRTLVLG